MCVLALSLAFTFTSCSDGSSGGSDDDSGQVTATVPKIYATAENITDKITNLTAGTHTLIVTGEVNGILTRNGDPSEIAAALIELKKNCPDAKVILDLSGTENLIEIPEAAFEGINGNVTDNLVGVVLPNTVTSIGNDSFCATGLTEISIPSNVKSIGNYAFSGCKNLASVKLPDGLASIGGRAFRFCHSLKSIVIPDSVTTLVGWETFGDCSSLTDVVIGSGVTEIPQDMFFGCTSLETVHIPVSVKKINAGAFRCFLDAAEKSFTVKYAGTVEQWNNIDVNMNASSVGATNAPLLKATIVCADGKSGTYEKLKEMGQ